MVSDEEKASIRDCQVGAGKASGSESLMTCRKLEADIETGVSMQSRDESGGDQPTGQAVSGIQATRARPAAFVWNGRRRVRKLSADGGREGVSRAVRNREGLSTVVGYVGGPTRSSGETSVMGVERRGRVVRDWFARSTSSRLGGVV